MGSPCCVSKRERGGGREREREGGREGERGEKKCVCVCVC